MKQQQQQVKNVNVCMKVFFYYFNITFYNLLMSLNFRTFNVYI